MLNTFKKEVEEKANEQTPLAFASALIIYKRRKRAGCMGNHENVSNSKLLNSDCNCSYCRNLKQYVKLKLEHHRKKKYFLNDSFPHPSSEKELNELRNLEEEFKKHKKEKDFIKEHLKL